MPGCLVIMGVSGVGKTTIAEMLAERCGLVLAEGDDFHPPGNIAKMSQGTPLTDADRQPWLHAIRDWIDSGPTDSIVTCSALKRRYRDELRRADARVRFVFLRGDRDLVASRIGDRRGHFMPAGLLESQFAALEPLQSDEDGMTVDVSGAPADTVEAIISRLRAG